MCEQYNYRIICYDVHRTCILIKILQYDKLYGSIILLKNLFTIKVKYKDEYYLQVMSLVNQMFKQKEY